MFTRRDFLASTTALLAVGAGVRRRAGPQPWTLFLGTYTRSGTSRGMYHVTVDPRTLAFGECSVAAECTDPSYLACTRDSAMLVAVHELSAFDGQASGSVSAFTQVAASAGRHLLRASGRARASRGAAPCHVTVDRSGRWALVANYGGGTVAVLSLANGTVGDAVQVVAHDGHGPDAKRQAGPHAHCIVLDMANRFAVSADLGADTLFVHRFDARTGTLTPAAAPRVHTRPGAGPRHLAFSPDGRTLYCANELDSTLAVYAYDAATGALTERQVLSTRAATATGVNAPAHVHVHPSGQTIYLSNRGDNTIAVFTRDATGTVSLTQAMSSGGDWPRHFALTPDGRGLLVAHQRSDSVVAFRLHPRSGHLIETGQVLSAPVPVCLVFA